MTRTPMNASPEERVRAAASRYDDERGGLAASALAALARRQATAGQECSACRVLKPFSSFSPDYRRNAGADSRCRACAATHRHEIRQRVRL
jgi:hypothetical protein